MSDQQKVVHGLSNGAIFNNLERPETQISRSGHSLTLNIFEMAKDTVIVTMDGEQDFQGHDVAIGLDALDVLCAQLTRDLFAIAKFLLLIVFVVNKYMI